MRNRMAVAAALAFALTALIALAAGGCARAPGPPRVALGTPCTVCGMEVRDPRYAAASTDGRAVRAYDSIECALRDRAANPAPSAPTGQRAEARSLYLSDFETASLHRADSLTIVRARIPSPMGGGLAAFLDRGEAERIAAAREGRIVPIDSLLGVSGASR